MKKDIKCPHGCKYIADLLEVLFGGAFSDRVALDGKEALADALIKYMEKGN